MSNKGDGYRDNTEENETKGGGKEWRDPEDLVPSWQSAAVCCWKRRLYARICETLNYRKSDLLPTQVILRSAAPGDTGLR